MDQFLQAAVDEAFAGLREADIPIGSVIVRGGENRTFLDDPTCIQMREDFIQEKPTLWNADIGKT